MEYFDNQEWIEEKFGLKIKFRIKEVIKSYKDDVTHTYYPQANILDIPEQYNIEHQGGDIIHDEQSVGWVYLNKIGFKEYEKAVEVCKKTKPFINKIEIKYHEL